MTRTQVEGYLNLFDRIATGGRVYLKQWERWRNPVDGITVDFSEYAIPATWQVVFDEHAPVQSDFRQAAWRVPDD